MEKRNDTFIKNTFVIHSYLSHKNGYKPGSMLQTHVIVTIATVLHLSGVSKMLFA
jgi:hypothetical protein